MILSIIVGIGLSLALLLPLALKWELRLAWVLPWALCVGALVGGAAGWWAPQQALSLYGVLLQILVILAASAAALAWRFFRDPERAITDDPRAVVAPADGVVIYINRFEPGQTPRGEKKKGVYSLRDFTQTELFNSGCTVIGIGMSFLDVHVNRSPVTGRVEMIRHIPGKFLSLKRPEALTANERALTVIRVGEHPVGIVQIASRLVRRIVSYIAEGDQVKAGDRIGMIKFGSQVDLILPDGLNASVVCRKGQQVYAGLTVLAERRG